MKSATRKLTIIGTGIVASMSLAVAPAQAATGTDAVTRPGSVAGAAQPHDWDDVVGYFRWRRDCERVGRIGERRDRWESYDCEFVRRGPERGKWRLEVERGWDDDDDHDYDGDHHGGGHHG